MIATSHMSPPVSSKHMETRRDMQIQSYLRSLKTPLLLQITAMAYSSSVSSTRPIHNTPDVSFRQLRSCAVHVSHSERWRISCPSRSPAVCPDWADPAAYRTTDDSQASSQQSAGCWPETVNRNDAQVMRNEAYRLV